MISRYARPEMEQVWSDESKHEIWLTAEIAALEKMEMLGDIPEGVTNQVREKADYSAERIKEIEEEVRHDVIAFLDNVAEHVGEESRFIHRGMTSSDLLDTSFSVQLLRASELINDGLDLALQAIKNRALEHKYTPTMGRSHGIHAEPTTFGLKLLGWYSELHRRKVHFNNASKQVCVGTISGPVGTYQSISPEVEAHVAQELGIGIEEVPTQIVSRDRHAEFFTSLALIASSIERFCVEIRHLQRTEVSEVAEPFGSGQKGSSAMPHKKNPIQSENITGLARLIRANAQAALDNVPLWHERDISHSSVKRVIAPDSCILMDFMLHRFTNVVDGLVVDSAKMEQNLDLTDGLYNSHSVLIALIDSGMNKKEAYKLVQAHTFAAWEAKEPLYNRLIADGEIVRRIGRDALKELFVTERHFRHVDLIFERTLKNK